MKISGIGYVYMITSPKGRIYVGSCVCEKLRWKSYKKLNCKRQVKLYNSFIKHGVENHIFEIVWAGPIEEMYKYETLIGWGFNVLEPENLNLQLPKLGNTWCSVSDETREKIGNFHRGKKMSEEAIRKITIAKIGKTASDETKKKMSKCKKGEKNYWFNKKMPKEARENMSKAKKGMKFSEEFIQMVANINKIPVIQMDLKGNFIKEWPSAKDAGKAISISNPGITACCRNKPKYKTAGGFKWKYKEVIKLN